MARSAAALRPSSSLFPRPILGTASSAVAMSLLAFKRAVLVSQALHLGEHFGRYHPADDLLVGRGLCPQFPFGRDFRGNMFDGEPAFLHRFYGVIVKRTDQALHGLPR